MADKQLTVSLALKASGYKKEIADINKDNQLLKSNFEKVSKSSKDFENNIEGQTQKLRLLSGQYDNAKKKVDVYKEALEKSKKTLDDASKSYDKSKQDVASLNSQLEDYKNTYGKTSSAVKALENELEKTNKEMGKQERAVLEANSSYKSMQINLNKAEIEANKLGDELNNTSSQIKSAGNSADKAASDFENLGSKIDESAAKSVEFGAHMTMIGQGLTTVGDKATDLGKKAISSFKEMVVSGAEYNASVASTEFLINNLDSTTQSWIDTNARNAENIGLTEKQFKELSVSVAGYGENMGLTGEETNGFTDKVMNLSANLGALKDVPVDEALRDVKSALMGNYEAVDKYNVNLSASMLENSEFVQSLGKSWNQLSDNEKMQAALNEMLRQGASANGLAAEEAKSFSMQMNLAKENIKETTGSIGDGLLPTMEPLINKFNSVVKVIGEWAKANPEITSTIIIVVGAVGGLLAILGPIITTIGMLTISIGALAPIVTAAGGIMGFFTASILPVIAVIGTLIGVAILLFGAIQANWEGIKQATINLINACSPQFEALKQSFSGLWKTCKSIYDTVIQPLFMVIGKVIEQCIIFATPLIKLLLQVFSDVINAISLVWNSIGKPIFDWMKTKIAELAPVFIPIFNSFKQYFSNACNAISSVWSNILYPVFQILIGVIAKIGSVVAPVFNGFASAISIAMRAVLTPIQSVIDRISSLLGWISDAGSKVGGFLSNLNPFKSRSIDIGVNYLNEGYQSPMTMMPMMARALEIPKEFSNIAYSGSYYNMNSVGNKSIESISKSTSSGVSKLSNDSYKIGVDEIANKIVAGLIEGLKGITLSADVNAYLDTERVSSELNRVDGRNINLYERFNGV